MVFGNQNAETSRKGIAPGLSPIRKQLNAQTKTWVQLGSNNCRKPCIWVQLDALPTKTNQQVSTSFADSGPNRFQPRPLIGGVQPMRYVALRGRHVSERPCRWVQFRSNKQTRNFHAMRSGILSNFRLDGYPPGAKVSALLAR